MKIFFTPFVWIICPGALRQNEFQVCASHKGTFSHTSSLSKGCKIHKLVSERVPKAQNYENQKFPQKVTISRNFDKHLVKINQNLEKNQTKFRKNRPKFRKKSLSVPNLSKFCLSKGRFLIFGSDILATS